MHHTVNPGDIGAQMGSNMQIGKVGDFDSSRIQDNKFCTFERYRPFYKGGQYRMIFSGIGSDNQNQIRLFNILDGVCHCATSESCGQTGHGGRMSETGAVIDIIGLKYRPYEFLGDIILFVGHPGRRQKTDTVGPMVIFYAP